MGCRRFAGYPGGGHVTRPGAGSLRCALLGDQLAALEQELRVALGTKVEIKQTSRGRGRIVVHFANHDEFERIRECMSDPDVPAPRVA